MKKIQDRDLVDRPRERLEKIGSVALTDIDLATAVIGSGNSQTDVTKIAQNLIGLLQKNSNPPSYQELKKISGLGQARICQILASFELYRRLYHQTESPVIDSPEKVLNLVENIRRKKQEYFLILTLDGANRLIKKHIVTIGTLTSSLVHPREVFAPALEDRAASIIAIHNHPSGALTASKSDLETTKRLKESGELLGVRLLDHLIVTSNDWASIV